MESIFDLLTINGDYRIIGSGSDKKIKYKSDYDLVEYINLKKTVTLTDIYHDFLNKFKYVQKHPTIFITDFKCGMNSDGEPLRWKYQDMKKGYKMVDGNHITFQEALKYKTTCKMDIIAILDDKLYEFSENYYFKSKHPINYTESDQSYDVILNSLLYSYDEYMNVQHNYFKGLKRAYSIYKLKHDPKQKKLIPFFNSYLGNYNKIRSDLKLIQFMKHRISKEIYDKNVGFIKEQIKGLKDGDKFHGNVNTLYKQIDNYINQKTLDFIHQHQDLLLD